MKEIKISDDPFQTIDDKLEVFRLKINELVIETNNQINSKTKQEVNP